MKLEVDPVDVNEKIADDRGRVTLGSEYSGQAVTVAVVEVHEYE